MGGFQKDTPCPGFNEPQVTEGSVSKGGKQKRVLLPMSFSSRVKQGQQTEEGGESVQSRAWGCPFLPAQLQILPKLQRDLRLLTTS